jgi:hypothetical protein
MPGSIVGFSGKMGSGKSTAALLAQQHLARITGEEWVVAAFADALKDIFAKISGVPFALCYTDVGKSIVPPQPLRGVSCEDIDAVWPLDNHSINRINEVIARESTDDKKHTVGRWLQIIGQAFRDVESDYWVNAFEARMQDGINYIVEDVRYPNEFEWIRDEQLGIVGRVVSGGRQSQDTGRELAHRSETALDACTAWHFEIENSGTEGDLMAELAKKLDPFFINNN